MKSRSQIFFRFSCLLMEFFLLSHSFVPVLAAPGTAAKREKRIIDVPFFSQVTFKDAVDSNGQSYLLGNSPDIPLWSDGCGVASLAMIYQKWGLPTCLPCLNDALKKSGGFSGALLRFDKPEKVAKAGAPFIKSIETIRTSKPQDYKERVDTELAAGRPVMIFINHAHFVVITGEDENGGYLVNDPWQRNEAEGKNIPIEKNLTGLGFDKITQFEFISPTENAPTNGVIVRGAIQQEYFARGGSKGLFGNPVSEDTEDTMFLDRYHWQKFENGVMLDINGEVRSIYGPLWKKVQQLGGLEKTGLPLGSQYSHWSGDQVIWIVDFEGITLRWGDKEPEDHVETLYSGKAIRVQFFQNGNLSGEPIHTSITDRIRSVWGNSRPIPWLSPDQYSIRWIGDITPAVGWFYTFRIEGDGRYRLYLDGKLILDAWDQGGGKKFTKYLGRGKHSFTIEFSKRDKYASMSFDWSAWPASPVFASEMTDGPVDYFPASLTDYLSQPTAQGSIFTEPDQPVRQLMDAIAAKDVDKALQALNPDDQSAGKLLMLGFQKATDLKDADGRVEFDEMDYSIRLDGADRAVVTVDGISDFYNANDELTDSRHFIFEIPVFKKDSSWYVSLDLAKVYELLKEYQNSE